MWGAALGALIGQLNTNQRAAHTQITVLGSLISKSKSVLNSLREVLQFETEEWLDDLSFSADIRQELQNDTDEWLNNTFD